MLKAKQFIFDIRCLAIDYYFNTDSYNYDQHVNPNYEHYINFFELKNLSDYYRSNIGFDITLGLGKGTMISGSHERYYINKENLDYNMKLYEYSFSFEIIKRLFKRAQLSLKWNKNYITWDDEHRFEGVFQFLL